MRRLHVLMADSGLCCWMRESQLCFSQSVTHIQCFGSQRSIRAQTRESAACIGLTGQSGGRLYWCRNQWPLEVLLLQTPLYYSRFHTRHCFDRKLHFSQLSAGQSDCFYGNEGRVLLLMTACQTLHRPVSVPHNHWDVFKTERAEGGRDVRSDGVNREEMFLISRRGP